MISHDEAVRLIEGPAAGLDELLARAAAVRDARGGVVTFSAKVFVPLTTLADAALLPHVNPGLMAERDLAALREVSVSMGLMLETTSERLLIPGGAHHRAPDKVPRRRLKTIELAGKLSIPFTTGILIGIGETPRERADALVAIRDLHERYGHVQEVIVQNFRAKPFIPMCDASEPTLHELLSALAVARLVLPPDVALQAPPNLSPRVYPRLLAAGLNDWGGISPLTPDHINPEKPWPGLVELRRATEAAGFVFRERLAVYPAFAGRPEFVDETLRARVAALVDGDGLVRQSYEHWRRW